MKNNIYSLVISLLFIGLLLASSSGKEMTSTTIKTYVEVNKKESEPYTLSYELPTITPTNGTIQTQKKGGVLITCEVIPFNVSELNKEKRDIFYADPKLPGYDIFQVKNTPIAVIQPESFIINIKIKNNQERILKIRETAMLMQIDGVTYNMPESDIKEWYAAMVIKNAEFSYRIKGPNIKNLNGAKLLYLFINDVPTEMDAAGNIKKRENFEWYFECKMQPIQKQTKITYTYPTAVIETSRCDICAGTGKNPDQQCTVCKGAGKNKNRFDGKIHVCNNCRGTGIKEKYCINCAGIGKLSFPKSKLPEERSSISWTGWKVNVVTNPPGAVVKVVNPTTRQYYEAGVSNSYINWNTSNSKSYPIIVEYQGKIIKVLPFNKKGKEISKIVIDFSGSQPIVKEGSITN